MPNIRKDIDENELMELYGSMSIHELARRYGVHHATVSNRISELLKACNNTGRRWWGRVQIVPIKEQHIDTDYIKGALQSEYLAMRRRERRSNDDTGNFCL